MAVVLATVIAAVPTILTDMAAFVGALAVFCAGLTVVVKFGPTRWLFRNLVSDPATEAAAKWVGGIVTQATGKILHLIDYHLGSNGTTKPIHERISSLEQALGLEVTEQQTADDDD